MWNQFLMSCVISFFGLHCRCRLTFTRVRHVMRSLSSCVNRVICLLLTLSGSWGEGVVLAEKIEWGGVPPSSRNPSPVSEQLKICDYFETWPIPYFRLNLRKYMVGINGIWEGLFYGFLENVQVGYLKKRFSTRGEWTNHTQNAQNLLTMSDQNS